MDTRQAALLAHLDAFTIGDPAAPFGFARRLARDNRWSIAFAQRVVAEYKRFVFLAMEAGHPVTPSDEVDQAWHLHLVYTRSYWEDLCTGLLGRPLHHGPTKGGRDEDDKFEDWYARTLESYARFFEHRPPADIWPPSAVRFGLAPHFRRVNTRRYWLVPRQFVRRSTGSTLVGVGAATGLVGCGVIVAQSSGGTSTSLILTVFIAAGVGVFLLLIIFAVKRSRGRPGDDGGCGTIAGGCAASGGGSSGGGSSGGGSSKSGSSGCGSSGCGSSDGGSGGDGGGGCGGGGD